MSTSTDGITGLPPKENMVRGARKLRDTYDIVPGAPFYQKEFGYYCLENWKQQGMPEDADFGELFGYDPGAIFAMWGLGWCEAGFAPAFETKVLEDRGEYELVQDHAGRKVLYFKGRRSGFMPEYDDHPVKDWKTWEENCKWRLDPATPSRWENHEAEMKSARECATKGLIMSQDVIGGYMYLRSLMGPEGALYMFHDQPDLVHDCMKTWFELADVVIAKRQEHISIDQLFFGEDICYNHGPLISPDMMREFLFPYYSQLFTNLKSRQIDKERKVFFHIDTDGFCDPVIPVYREIGVDVMSPFEVAAGCDVVRAGREYPDMVIHGGVDKRVLAQGPDAIDRMIDSIFPVMMERGGYIPTCDHGVPEEVSYENYLHFRKRCLEFS